MSRCLMSHIVYWVELWLELHPTASLITRTRASHQTAIYHPNVVWNCFQVDGYFGSSYLKKSIMFGAFGGSANNLIRHCFWLFFAVPLIDAYLWIDNKGTLLPSTNWESVKLNIYLDTPLLEAVKSSITRSQCSERKSLDYWVDKISSTSQFPFYF